MVNMARLLFRVMTELLTFKVLSGFAADGGLALFSFNFTFSAGTMLMHFV